MTLPWLVGTLPSSWASMTEVNVLDFEYNSLTGAIQHLLLSFVPSPDATNKFLLIKVDET